MFPNLRSHSFCTMFLRLKEKKSRVLFCFVFFSWVFLWDWACKEKKMWNAIDLAACWVPPVFFSIVMLKQNELKPLLNLPQSSLHQPSGCDSWVLALWCQIWKFSLPLKNKQKTQKQTYSHLMHYNACYFVLATMNYNSFKDIMEKRRYINKKKPACWTCMV